MSQDVLARLTIDPSAREQKPLERLSDLITYRISVLNRAMEQQASRGVAKAHGLSLTEVRVLGILHELSPTTVKHIADVMRLKRPQVSRALSLLRDEELVEAWENPTDGRSTNYEITKKGRRRVIEVLDLASFFHHDRLNRLTVQERAALDSALEKLLAAALEPNNKL